MAGNSPARKATNRRAPAKKAAAAKAAVAKVTAPGGVFDLDNLSKAEAFPDLNLPDTPFPFVLDGHSYELTDPRDKDWKQAWVLAQNPFLLMRACLVDADKALEEPTEQEIAEARVRLGLDGGEDQDDESAEGEDGDNEPESEEPEVVPTVLDRFTAAPLPGWKLNALLENWARYNKIDLSKGRGILDALLGRNGQDE